MFSRPFLNIYIIYSARLEPLPEEAFAVVERLIHPRYAFYLVRASGIYLFKMLFML